MTCPFCKANQDRVIDSQRRRDHIRRRRTCDACGKRFTTHERIEARPNLASRLAESRR